MADFVAVIRRAVDGLTNNTPEMRAKVYDKARSAVTRQLENMSPRPPEETLRRQLVKLDSAILEVESEHAEAMLAFEEQFEAAPEPAPVIAPPPQEPTAYVPPFEEAPAEPEVAYQRDEPRFEPSPPAYEEPEPQEEPEAPYEPVVEPQVEAGVEAEPEAWDEAHFAEPPAAAPEPEAEPEPEPEEPVYAQPPQVFAEPYVASQDEPDDEPAPVVAVEPEVVAPAVEPPAISADDSWESEVNFGTPSPDTAEAFQPERNASAWEEQPAAPAYRPSWPDAPSLEPEVRRDEPEPETTFDPWLTHDEPAAYEPAAPEAQAPEPLSFNWNDANTDVRLDPAAGPIDSNLAGQRERDELDDFLDGVKSDRPGAQMPAAIDLLDWDNFGPTTAAQPTAASQPAAVAPTVAATTSAAAPFDSADDWFSQETEQKKAGGNALDELETLVGQARPVTPQPSVKRGTIAQDEMDDFPVASEGSAYRIEPKPRRNYAPLVLGLAGAVILAGGAYATWANRSVVSEFVSGLVSSAPSTSSSTAVTDAPTADGAAATTTAVETPPATTPVVTEAAPDGSVAGQKFTQRLKTDGTEIDEGVAAASSAAGTEGKSIAEQNAGSAPQPAVQSGAGAGAAAAPAARSEAALPAGSQKAFLYEERLGQTAPTAIPGNIVWTALTEPGDNAKPEPVIQGKLSVPSVGLTALITFKRNGDSSLPASHLAEIVFSLPADFEGGAIEAVDRVAMKRTEQDRGDALVAVAAKVTDDTFLIAFNDFQDVVAHNIDLLRSRDWIDIPVTYRNGRRALLTLDKGVEGAKVFDSVIKEWAALGTTNGG